MAVMPQPEENCPEKRKSLLSTPPCSPQGKRSSISLLSAGTKSSIQTDTPTGSQRTSRLEGSNRLEARVRSSVRISNSPEIGLDEFRGRKRSTFFLTESSSPSSVCEYQSEAPTQASPKFSFQFKRRGNHGRQFTTFDFHTRLASLRRMEHTFLQEPTNWREKFVSFCGSVVSHKYFNALSLLGLLAALFLPDVWVLADRPDNTDLDVLLTLVFVVFAADVVMQTVALSGFLWSFSFWTDLLGALLLLLDISYFPFFLAGHGVYQSLLLTARFARLGARACRLGRMLKLLRFLPWLKLSPEASAEGMVNVMSCRLNQALSSSVSLLIIVAVTVIPVFSMWTYPEVDWSGDAWLEILETIGTRNPEQLDEQLVRLGLFYEDMPYFPMSLVARFANLPERRWEPGGRVIPVRRWNIRRVTTEHIECNFNLKAPNQREALLNIAIMLLVMLLLGAFSFLLSKTVSSMIIAPVKRLLSRLVSISQNILTSVSMMADKVQTGRSSRVSVSSEVKGNPSFTSKVTRRMLTVPVEDQDQAGNEMRLLQDILDRLSIVAAYVMGAKDGKDQVSELDAEGHAILVGVAGVMQEGRESRKFVKSSVLESHLCIIQSVGLSLELVDSWNFNPLGLDTSRCHAVCMFFLSPCHHSVPIETPQLQSFLAAAESNYNNVPFHSWFHAVDVTHCMYRFLAIFKCSLYLGCLDRYALLVSAIAHDLGHCGMKNQFLVETSHELALRYNDASPLENMHCQRLFEIMSIPRNNILGLLNRKQMKEVRHVCVEAILHTDISHHFKIIKELQIMYEMNSKLQETFQLCSLALQEWPTEDAQMCFQEKETGLLLCRLLLHLSDISNPAKPFRICRVWAYRCLDEFFAQGDAELAAGLPISSLHDRSKVNREYSQIGFIEFLIAPLAFPTMRLLTPYLHCVEQLLDNVRQWQELWLRDAKPSPQELEAVEARLQKLDRRFVDGT